jgi:hypothetical protein
MAHREKPLAKHQEQLKTIIQSYGIDAYKAGDKMLIARVAFIIQLLGDVDTQVKELLKELSTK